MADKTIITCAVTGSITRPEQHPDLPITPAQIASAAIDAAKAGAAIAHIHVRDPQTGAPSMDARALPRGGRADPRERHRSDHQPHDRSRRALRAERRRPQGGGARARPWCRPERRVEHVVALRPEICSLDLNTMWFGSAVVINTPRNAAIMARGDPRRPASCRSSRCSIPATSSSPISCSQTACCARPPLFQLVLGIRNGFPATPETLLYARSLLPADALWAAMGIGRMEFPIVAQACLLGGHVRVGLEDNLYLSKGVLAPSNAALVERAVTHRRAARPQRRDPRRGARDPRALQADAARSPGQPAGRGAALGWSEAVGRRPSVVSR